MNNNNSTNISIDTEVLELILIKLVNHPKDIKIERSIDERGVLIMVNVNPEDMGIVIGREGRMVDSIRYVIKGVGLANNMNVRVYFLEPDGSFRYSDKVSNKGDLDKIENNGKKLKIKETKDHSIDLPLN